MNLPQVDFYLREAGEWVTKTTTDIFLDKRSVLVLVPGAFTPTCSEQQLPGFEKAYDKITKLGIDQVLCLAVNDAFVMNAWGKSLGIKKVQLLPDGNGAFTTGLKAAVAKENLGMGARAWRLALIINENGMVEWAGIEDGQRPNATDDPYAKSTPEEVIKALQQLKAAAKEAAAAPAA